MKKVLLLPLLSCWLHFTYAQTGELDPTFGNKGIVATDMDSAYGYSNIGRRAFVQPDGSIYVVSSVGNAVLITKKHSNGSPDYSYGNHGSSALVGISERDATIQSDGKIIVLGSGYVSPIIRFNTDGSLDSAFNANARHVVTGVDSYLFNSNVALQSDGKIVVASTYQYFNSIYDYVSIVAVIRYNADGTLNKFVLSNFGVAEGANAMAIGNDNKILVGGDYALIRYNSDLTLDLTLNGTGRQDINFPGPSAVALQSDGKMIAATNILQRYNAAGGIDNTFNGTGEQDVLFGGIGDVVISMQVQNNYKIDLSGYKHTSSGYNFAVARYNTDGSPDDSFSGDGIQIAGFNSNNSQAYSLTVASNGEVTAIGLTVEGGSIYTAIARFNADGSPDNSFDNDGLLVDRLSQGSTFYNAVDVDAVGKIVTAGYTWNGSNYDFAIVRYNTDGSPDNTFSGDGKQMIGFSPATTDIARVLAIQNNGKIVVAGTAGSDFKIIRLNYSGSLDNTFNGNGVQTTDVGIAESVNSLNIQKDGKILVGDGYWLTRYNTDGTLDNSFGQNGKLNINPFKSYQAVIQPDNKIVVLSGGAAGCRIIRYNPDGSPDNSFGNLGNGVQSGYDFDQDYNNYFDARSIALAADGKIVIGGFYTMDNKSGGSSYFAVLRLNTDGSFDQTFNGGVLLETDINNQEYGTSVKVQSDNKIILAGYAFDGFSNDFTLLRYNTDGSLDTSFSNDGVQVTPASILNDQISSIVISGNNLYAAGYGQYPGNFGVVARYLLGECGPLKVNLVNFVAAPQHKQVLLKWHTEGEQNLAGFTIERSADGNSFHQIGYVDAKGSDNSKADYVTMDKQPTMGVNYYRLKLNNLNDKFTYSKTETVTITDEAFALKLSPNPARNMLFIQANGNGSGSFIITDVSGIKIKEIKVSLSGENSFSINISTLPEGIYTLQLQTRSTTATKRFIKE